MTACRTCKAPVMWVVTVADEWLVVDAEPHQNGNVLLEGGNPPRARVLEGPDLKKARAAQCRLYRAHARSQEHQGAAA